MSETNSLDGAFPSLADAVEGKREEPASTIAEQRQQQEPRHPLGDGLVCGHLGLPLFARIVRFAITGDNAVPSSVLEQKVEAHEHQQQQQQALHFILASDTLQDRLQNELLNTYGLDAATCPIVFCPTHPPLDAPPVLVAPEGIMELRPVVVLWRPQELVRAGHLDFLRAMLTASSRFVLIVDNDEMDAVDSRMLRELQSSVLPLGGTRSDFSALTQQYLGVVAAVAVKAGREKKDSPETFELAPYLARYNALMDEFARATPFVT